MLSWGFRINCTAAFVFFLQLSAFSQSIEEIKSMAEHGDAEAQVQLGRAYMFGRGVAEDRVQGAKWTMKAAEQGYSKAQRLISMAYEFGMGVETNFAKAFDWGIKAAAAGDATAQFLTAVRYRAGRGVAQDRVESYKWYSLAAEQGDKTSIDAREKLRTELTKAEIAAAKQKIADHKDARERLKNSNSSVPDESSLIRGRVDPTAYSIQLSSDWKELSPKLVTSADRVFQNTNAAVFITIMHFPDLKLSTEQYFAHHVAELEKQGGAPPEVIQTWDQGIWKFFQIRITAKDGYSSTILGYLTGTTKGCYMFFGALQEHSEHAEKLFRDAFFNLKLPQSAR